MKEVVNISFADVVPDKVSILKNQGIFKLNDLTDKVNKICDEALNIFKKLNNPIGLYAELSHEQFEQIYEGEGENETSLTLKSSQDSPVSEETAQ